MARRRARAAHDGLARHALNRVTHAEARTRIDRIAELHGYSEFLIQYLDKLEAGVPSEFDAIEQYAFAEVIEFLRHRGVRDLLAEDSAPPPGGCCGTCGITLVPGLVGSAGRPRKYCSSRCRQRAYRGRKGARVRRSPLDARLMMAVQIEAVRRHPDDVERLERLQGWLLAQEPAQTEP
ncbi:hypothetical protein ACWFRF_28955 [Nocardia sp. NPDC055165]